MKSILVAYATREGHTQKVAERIASCIERAGRRVALVDAKTGHFPDCAGAILAASVHMGEHDSVMVDYVRYHRGRLWELPNAFLSVSLHEAVQENRQCSPVEQEDAKIEVNRALKRFYEQTGWHPNEVHPVAGALAYSTYGFLKRLVMQRMAKEKGLSDDASRDHDYTDWSDVELFVDQFLTRIHSDSSEVQPRLAASVA
ncbi:MAG TPA: flavodoxin domain-containing protein [Myxococcales bacterium LLY-WYZ-16_1]|nr:flavodoxin domain-containing protein [Myxococcales bacterium LLY-WYZ-16_1]